MAGRKAGCISSEGSKHDHVWRLRDMPLGTVGNRVICKKTLLKWDGKCIPVAYYEHGSESEKAGHSSLTPCHRPACTMIKPAWQTRAVGVGKVAEFVWQLWPLHRNGVWNIITDSCYVNWAGLGQSSNRQMAVSAFCCLTRELKFRPLCRWSLTWLSIRGCSQSIP